MWRGWGAFVVWHSVYLKAIWPGTFGSVFGVCRPLGALKLSKKMGGEAPHLFGSFYCPLGFPRPQKLAQQFTARLPSDTQALCDYVVITRTTKQKNVKKIEILYFRGPAALAVPGAREKHQEWWGTGELPPPKGGWFLGFSGLPRPGPENMCFFYILNCPLLRRAGCGYVNAVSEEAASLVTLAVSGAFIEGIHLPALGAGIYRGSQIKKAQLGFGRSGRPQGAGNPKFGLNNLALLVSATPRCRHMRHGERSFGACRLGQASGF